MRRQIGPKRGNPHHFEPGHLGFGAPDLDPGLALDPVAGQRYLITSV
jgi:hypothetical protein